MLRLGHPEAYSSCGDAEANPRKLPRFDAVLNAYSKVGPRRISDVTFVVVMFHDTP